MTYCLATNCKRKCDCNNWVGNAPTGKSVPVYDWSTSGSGSITASGCTVMYDCGDNTSDYPRYERLVPTETEQRLHSTLKELNIELYDITGHKRTCEQLLCDLAFKIVLLQDRLNNS